MGEGIMLESLGWFFIGVGSCGFLFFGYHAVEKVKVLLRKKKFDDFIRKMRAAADQYQEDCETKAKARQDNTPVRESGGQEVSMLSFRDKFGVFNTVKIIVDHDLDDSLTDEDKGSVRNMIISEDGSIPEFQGMLREDGTPTALLKSHLVEESKAKKIEQFVF